MKSYTHIAMTFAALVLSQVALAADPDDEALKKLDQNLDAAKAFEHGQDNGPLMEIEQLVFYVAARFQGPRGDRTETDCRAAICHDQRRQGFFLPAIAGDRDRQIDPLSRAAAD